jgi:cytochrome c oxidase subunit IV
MAEHTLAVSGHSAVGHGHDDHAHHVMPLWILFAVFAALISLTIITVAASSIVTQATEIWVAMGIATVKALLVATYFMHLRHDKPLNVLAVTFSLLFVVLFLGICLADSVRYQDQIKSRDYDVTTTATPATPAPATTPAPPVK